MKLVVDTNIVISLLIKPSSLSDLFFYEDLELIAPTLLAEELQRNKGIIIQKSELPYQKLDDFLQLILLRITFISEQKFLGHIQAAEHCCPDPKDIVFFALCLAEHCPLWSHEKKLQQQTVVPVYDTPKVIEIISRHSS